MCLWFLFLSATSSYTSIISMFKLSNRVLSQYSNYASNLDFYTCKVLNMKNDSISIIAYPTIHRHVTTPLWHFQAISRVSWGPNQNTISQLGCLITSLRKKTYITIHKLRKLQKGLKTIFGMKNIIFKSYYWFQTLGKQNHIV